MMTLGATAKRIVSAGNNTGIRAEKRAVIVITVISAVSMLAGSTVSAQQLDQPIEQRVEANQMGAESQKRVEVMSTATDELVSEYRLTNKKIESLNIFNRQLSEVIVSQNEELASLQRQIDDVEEVGRSVTPLMLKMIDSLAQFVEIDIPFLSEKRRARVDGLRVLMRRSDVADAERYRRILEAYQVESDFGRTIEAYAGVLEKDGGLVPVDFLRVGRIGLIYQTRDLEEVGAWNAELGAFEILDSSYFNWVSEGLRVAKKQSAPQLIRIPLAQPEQGGRS
jgi:hypothetical protein